VISKFAIDDFIKRPRRDSRRAKRFSRGAIDRKLAKLRPRPRFHTKPKHHQKVCFLLDVKYPGYLNLLDTGLGKTKLMLDLFRYRKRCKQCACGLVLVPNTSNVWEWIEQGKEHAPTLRIVGLTGDKNERLDKLHGDADLIVTTYAGWFHLVCQLKAKRGKKKKMVIHVPTAKRLGKLFDFVCFDESTNFKNHRSLTYKTARRLSKQCTYRYCLTGTPFGRNPQDLWAQFFVVDHGYTLGETLGLFRGAFFNEKDNFWSGGTDWEFDEDNWKTVSKFLRHCSIRYRIEDCVDMPAKTENARRVLWSLETRAYYDKLIKELQGAKSFKLMDNVFMRMRQLTSGFLVVKDPEGKRFEIVFKENPKLDALVDDIKEIAPPRKVVVFNEFIKSGQFICDRLKQEGIKHLRLFGGTKDKGAVLAKFKRSPAHRVLVSSKTGAYGINLQKQANYVFLYEAPTSPIVYKQMIARVYRMGQKRKVFIREYAVKGSIDEKIRMYRKEGKDLHDLLIEDGGRQVKRVLRLLAA
jgi:SNF2 family DNA or RNA helicase